MGPQGRTYLLGDLESLYWEEAATLSELPLLCPRARGPGESA